MTLSEWACPRAVSRSVCENADMREKVVICVMSEANEVCLLYDRFITNSTRLCANLIVRVFQTKPYHNFKSLKYYIVILTDNLTIRPMSLSLL